MKWELKSIASALSGAELIGDSAVTVERVHTDTRTLQAGDLYVAIVGDTFDGNAMLAQAKSKGATAAIAHVRAADGLQALGLPGVQVPDTRKALGELGRAWRQGFTGPLIAVTGSNGKTTVTQMIASILRAHAGQGAHATRNSFNNDIGLPLTLLALRDQHTHAVVEIGMNHPGEISALATLAWPTIALVNNAQREHQEFMGSVEAVAAENAAVFAHTQPKGFAVFPSADAFTPLWKALAQESGLKVTTFGAQGDFSVQAQSSSDGQLLTMQTPDGPLSTTLKMPGLHNASNALAAAACAWCAGVPLEAIGRGLSAFEAVVGRSRVVALHGAHKSLALIDDSYNANPDSVRAAIDVLSGMPAPQVLILGDMGEVGHQGPEFHAEAGQYAALKGIELLVGCGPLAKHAVAAHVANGGGRSRVFSDVDDAIAELGAGLQGAASVLVKGSRFMRMERVVRAIEALDRVALEDEKGDGHAA